MPKGYFGMTVRFHRLKMQYLVNPLGVCFIFPVASDKTSLVFSSIPLFFLLSLC